MRIGIFINRKSHMGFLLESKSVTLHDLERSNDRRRALSLRQLSFFFCLLPTVICHARFHDQLSVPVGVANSDLNMHNALLLTLEFELTSHC